MYKNEDVLKKLGQNNLKKLGHFVHNVNIIKSSFDV